jgi:hypothetical protein
VGFSAPSVPAHSAAVSLHGRISQTSVLPPVNLPLARLLCFRLSLRSFASAAPSAFAFAVAFVFQISNMQNNSSKTAQNSLVKPSGNPSIPATPTIKNRSTPKKVCLLGVRTLLFLRSRDKKRPHWHLALVAFIHSIIR